MISMFSARSGLWVSGVDEAGQAKVHRNEAGGEAVGKSLNRRLAMRRFLDQVHDARHGRVVADLLRRMVRCPALTTVPANTASPICLRIGMNSPVIEAWSTAASPSLDDAVDADLFAGLHDDAIPDAHLLDRDLHLPAVLLESPDVSLAHGEHVANGTARTVHRIDGEQLARSARPMIVSAARSRPLTRLATMAVELRVSALGRPAAHQRTDAAA